MSNYLTAQIALPTFHGVHKSQTSSDSNINVLIIWDNSASNSNTLSLKTALENEGFTVSLSDTRESSYDGTNPALTNFNAVIHLNGTTYSNQMPTAGQTALVNFVNTQGGLYCHSEWLAYQRGRNQYSTMSELIILNRTSGHSGSTTYTEVADQSSHPILNDIPSSFTFSSGGNKGSKVSYGSNPVTVLMKFGSYEGVMIRSYGNGKIMGMSHAGNWSSYSTLSDSNIQQLYINAINWAN